jgi:hypothetical protein
MRVTIQGGDQSLPMGPVERIAFTSADGVRRTYRVASYTHEPYVLGHRAEVFELEPMSGYQEPVVASSDLLPRLRGMRTLIASNNGGQIWQALSLLDEIIDEIR